MKYAATLFENVNDYINGLDEAEQVKIYAAINHLREQSGYLDEPLSKHVSGKIRELIIGRHRILYSAVKNKIILFLTAFYKTTEKTPRNIIDRAAKMLDNYLKELD